jgi:hypothetical protein
MLVRRWERIREHRPNRSIDVPLPVFRQIPPSHPDQSAPPRPISPTNHHCNEGSTLSRAIRRPIPCLSHTLKA